MNYTNNFDPLDPATYAVSATTIPSSAVSIGNFNNIAMNHVAPRIQIQGDAEFQGNITWQGRDMRSWFESVEARLAILHPNPALEKEWSELSELRQQYVELERYILAKQKTFDILRSTNM